MSEDSGSFSLIKLDGKPLEKLIETVSAGIGTLYRPRAIRKESEAKAFEVEQIAKAQAKANLIKFENEHEIAERVKQRLYHQEMQRQLNVDNVVDVAAKFLNPNVSEEPVDPDWRTQFFNKAQDITSQDLQELWGKILAQEINQPGNVSLRTLNVVSALSKKEALKFTDYCKLCNSFGDVIKLKNNDDFTKYGLSFDDLLLLREAGLVKHADNLSTKYFTREIVTDKPKQAFIIQFPTRGMIIHRGLEKEFHFEILPLTISGLELFKISKPNQSDDYFEDLKTMLINDGYEIQETRLVYRTVK